MKDKKGFTLIELLVVVAIIGILAAVGVVAYNGYTFSAKVAVAKANFKLVTRTITNEFRKCDLGESEMMWGISCSLTEEQRVGQLVSSANTAKAQKYFGDGMMSPFDTNVHALWPGSRQQNVGKIGIERDAGRGGVIVTSPVSTFKAGTKNNLRCSQTPNDGNCFEEFIKLY